MSMMMSMIFQLSRQASLLTAQAARKVHCATWNRVVSLASLHRGYHKPSSILERQQTNCFKHNIPKRQFWGLDAAFNKVDEERVRLAGPDRACAEWVLRNGGAIKWTSSGNYLDDFNLLPTTEFDHYKLEAIDLSGTDVVSMGFLHLENLQHVKHVRLHGCRRISDASLDHLLLVKDTLQSLEVSWCPMITTKGLDQIPKLKNLKHLTIYGLIEVRDLKSVTDDLIQKMPWCQISTEEPQDPET